MILQVPLATSEIPDSGDLIRDIFEIIGDAREKVAVNGVRSVNKLTPQSSLIVLDYPSYLEKNMDTFGYYAVPIHTKPAAFSRR